MRITAVVAIMLSASLVAQSTAGVQQRSANEWPTAAPDEVGLDAKVLNGFDADIAAGKYGNVDSLLVVRHGRAALDRSYAHDYDRIYSAEARTPGPLNAHDPSGPYNYFNPWWHPFYHHGNLHTMQSVTKTVTSVVIGIATGRGEFPSLDTPVLKFFDASTTANVDDRKRRMTIRHLLTMTAGFDWNEDLPYADPNNASSLMEATFDWVRFAIDRPMATEPGRSFRYNSGATQILSYIFRTATGHDIEEYAERYLFTPLGIDHYYWKRTPTGLVDTEGGLYLSTHDLAKIAYLYLKDGVWNGAAIVPPEWVKASLTPAIEVGDGIKYGYKWWLYPYGQDNSLLAFGGSGLGGQRPLVMRQYDLVVVCTAWNILPGRRGLSPRVAIDRVVQAVKDR
jgi:CubicO group peptidase (beta-lactamase class C family)